MARILVIDDDQDVRILMRRSLEAADHQILEAGNGREGLTALANAPVDLVITDILMPEKEGIETISELRRGNPMLKILAISGGGRTGMVEFLNMAKKFGANDSLMKPFRTAELLAKVQHLLNAPIGSDQD